MSIYATILSLEEDEPGTPGAPYVYRASHIVPSLDGPRAGWLEVARIPDYVEGVGEAWRNFLRLDVCGEGDEAQTVLLDRRQVTAVIDTLNRWLDDTAQERDEWE
jgi:hypothetical protein